MKRKKQPEETTIFIYDEYRLMDVVHPVVPELGRSGIAVIIAGPDGEPLAPCWIPREWPVWDPYGPHAWFVAQPGLHIVYARKPTNYDFFIQVSKIVDIRKGARYYEADLEVVAEYKNGKWEPQLPRKLEKAVEAAKAKATCPGCQHIHYAQLE